MPKKTSEEIYQTLDFGALTEGLEQVWPIPISRVGLVSPKILVKWLNERNPREHSARQHGVIDALARKTGFVGFIGVMEITRNGEVIATRVLDGHMRIRESVKQQIKALPTVFSTVDEENEAQLLAEYDASGGLATINSAKMKELLSSIPSVDPISEEFLAELEARLELDGSDSLEPLDFDDLLGGGAGGIGDIEGLDTGSGAKPKGKMVKLPFNATEWDEFMLFLRRLGKSSQVSDDSGVMIFPPRH